MITNRWLPILIVFVVLTALGNIIFFGYRYWYQPSNSAQTRILPPGIVEPTPVVRDAFASITAAPTPTPTLRPLPPFDADLGNNYYAAKHAASVSAQFSRAFPAGAVQGLSVRYDPQETGGADELDYYVHTLKNAVITVRMDPAVWADTADTVKTQLVTLLVKTQREAIYVYPQVLITDGTRTVATGAWSTENAGVVVHLTP